MDTSLGSLHRWKGRRNLAPAAADPRFRVYQQVGAILGFRNGTPTAGPPATMPAAVTICPCCQIEIEDPCALKCLHCHFSLLLRLVGFDLCYRRLVPPLRRRGPLPRDRAKDWHPR